MKEFDKMLMENNIKKPMTALGIKLFDKKWIRLYWSLVEEWDARHAKWEEIIEELRDRCGVDVSKISFASSIKKMSGVLCDTTQAISFHDLDAKAEEIKREECFLIQLLKEAGGCSLFEKCLNENNIKKPRTALGNKLFEKRWGQVSYDYWSLVAEWRKRDAEWEEIRKELQDRWEFSFPRLCEIAPIPKMSFSSCSEAENMRRVSLSNLEAKQDSIAREKWIKQILKERSNALVVIRFGSVYEDAAMRFEEKVKQKKEASITLTGGGGVIWVSFNPNKPFNMEKWIMSKKDSVVEYIQ